MTSPNTTPLNTECPICRDDLGDSDEVVTLPCNHAVHRECGNNWVRVTFGTPVSMGEIEMIENIPAIGYRTYQYPEVECLLCRSSFTATVFGDEHTNIDQHQGSKIFTVVLLGGLDGVGRAIARRVRQISADDAERLVFAEQVLKLVSQQLTEYDPEFEESGQPGAPFTVDELKSVVFTRLGWMVEEIHSPEDDPKLFLLKLVGLVHDELADGITRYDERYDRLNDLLAGDYRDHPHAITVQANLLNALKRLDRYSSFGHISAIVVRILRSRIELILGAPSEDMLKSVRTHEDHRYDVLSLLKGSIREFATKARWVDGSAFNPGPMFITVAGDLGIPL